MTLERAQQIFRTGIKFKKIPDTKWLSETLEKLEAGTADPLQCWLEYKHRKWMWHMTTTKMWSGNHFKIDKFAKKRIFPPRPMQTRLAIMAAQKCEIITLHGPSRTGKTTAAVRAAMMISAAGDNPSIFSISGMRMSFFNKENMDEAIGEAISSHTIILDDIDKGSKGDVMINGIFEILCARENEHFKGTVIVTTNLFGKDLANQLRRLNPSTGDAIVAKLQAGICIDFTPEKINFEGTKEYVLQKMIEQDPNAEDWREYLEGFGRFNS